MNAENDLFLCKLILVESDLYQPFACKNYQL